MREPAYDFYSSSCAYSGRSPCFCELILGIAVHAKNVVVLRLRSFAHWTEIGVHILFVQVDCFRVRIWHRTCWSEEISAVCRGQTWGARGSASPPRSG